MTLSVSMPNLETLLARWSDREQVLQNLEPELRAAAQAFGVIEARRFATAGDGTWQPNTPATAAYKAQLGMPGPVMQRSGRLRAALTTPEVLQATTRTITVGTTLPYARFHQTGFLQRWYLALRNGRYVLRRRTRPVWQAARTLIALSASDRAAIAQAFASELVRRLEMRS